MQPTGFTMLNDVVAAKLAPVIRNLFCSFWAGIPGEPSVDKCKQWYDLLRECVSLPDDKLVQYTTLIRSQFPQLDWSLSELYRRNMKRNNANIDVSELEVDLIQIVRDLLATMACSIANDSKLVRRSHLSKLTTETANALRLTLNSRLNLDLLNNNHATIGNTNNNMVPSRPTNDALLRMAQQMDRTVKAADELTSVQGDDPYDDDNMPEVDDDNMHGVDDMADGRSQYSVMTSRD
jgi:hypothetical protein